MANGKKIYSIQINGIEQSVKSVDSLIEKISQLQKSINSIKKIDIPISIGDGDNKKISEEIKNLKKELNDLKESTKNIDLGSEEYSKAIERVEKLNKSFKEYDNLIKKNSTEKLNNSIKETVEETENLSDNIDDIKKKFDSLKGIKLDTDAVKRYGLSINDLKWQISQLEKSIEGMSIGSEQWQATNRELLDLKQTLALVQKEMEAAVRAEDQLNTKLKMTINGMSLEFDDVNQAIGLLEDKMYALAAAGKQNTKEFKDMADAASKLKIQVKAVDAQIDAMAEGGIGINKALSYTQGFSSILTGAEGLSNLFGGNEDATKTIATMTSLIGVLQAIQSIKQQMAQGDAFGQMLTKWNVLLNSSLSLFNKLSESLQNLYNGLKGKNFASEFEKQIERLILTSENGYRTMEKFKQAASNIGISGNSNFEVVENVIEAYKRLSKKYQEAQINGQQLTEEETRQFKALSSLSVIALQLEQVFIRMNNATYTAKDAWKALWIQIKTGLSTLSQTVKSFFSLNHSLGQVGQTTATTTRGFNAMVGAIKVGTLAVKAFSAALKATIILAVVQALMKMVDWLTNMVVKLKDAALGNDKLVNSLDTVKSRLDSTSASIERFNKGIDRLKEMGALTELDAMAEKMEYLELQTKKAVKELQQFIKITDKAQSLNESATDDNYTWFGIASNIENVEDFTKAYEKLLKAVESGKDENFGKGFSSWWFTASDAKSDLGEMQKKVIGDIQDRINNIDLSKGKQELESFFEKIDSEMYKTSLDNIENLYPEEEWAQVLKERLDALRDMYEQWDEMSNEQKINELNNLKDVNKQIRDNNTEAIADDYERQMAQLQNQLQDEIEAAEGNQSLILSIRKKYNRMEIDLIKQHNDQIKSENEARIAQEKSDAEALNSVLRQIRDNQLAIEEESLDKRIKALENAKNDEIEDARANGIMVNELILSIEQKYNKLIEDEKKSHYDYLNNLAEEYARKEIELQQVIKDNELQTQERTLDINYNTKSSSSNGSFDFDAQYGDRIEAEKEFSKQRLEIELDYLEERLRLDNEYAKLESEDNIINENNRYKDRLKELESFYKEGQLSLDEYNSYVEKENNLHKTNMEIIQTTLNNNLLSLNDEYINEVKEKTSKSLTENANLYSEYIRQVMDIMGNIGANRNIFGILSYSETKKQIDGALKAVNEGINSIDKELINLKNKLDKNEISFIDYKDARQQLEETKKELETQGKNIITSMSGLFSQVASGWKGVFDGFVSQISSLLSTLNDTQLQLIDNQLTEIERELEIQEEAYEKAEEAAQAHKDKMDSIEEELSDARGSRRQFLIDTLAAQQAAYLEDIAAQQKAEAEKEKLEQKQQALEKKRQEQEKKSKTQQAIINTYTAVSNALAVSPWFVGLALSAVALALGMKNVAAIKATPIYEDGGVIQGARHSQGGVKVLGGQAEVEGGEFITNRKSTAKNLPLLTYINDKKREVTPQELMEFFSNGTPRMKSKSTRIFANGGQLPTTQGSEVNRVVSVADTTEDNSTYVVQVVDIVNATNNLKKVQVLSGLVNE